MQTIGNIWRGATYPSWSQLVGKERLQTWIGRCCFQFYICSQYSSCQNQIKLKFISQHTLITEVLIHCCSCPFETFVDLGISCCLMVNWIFIGMPATVVIMLLHKLFQLLIQMLDMPPHAKGSNWVLPKRFQWQWQGNQVKLWQTFLFILENLSLMWLLGPCLSLVTVNDCQCLLLF